MALVWQPFAVYQGKYGFGIKLDRCFALEMIAAKVPKKLQDRMNVLGEELNQKIGYSYPSPYDFHKDTAFVSGFYLGSNGIWLALDDHLGAEPLSEDRPLQYSSHNVDASRDAYALMALVDMWVEYSEVLKKG